MSLLGMMTHTAAVARPGVTADAGGAPKYTGGSTAVGSLRCNPQAAKAAVQNWYMSRGVEVTVTVFSATDPATLTGGALKRNDRLTLTPGGRVLVVESAPVDRVGRGRLWEFECSEFVSTAKPR